MQSGNVYLAVLGFTPPFFLVVLLRADKAPHACAIPIIDSYRELGSNAEQPWEKDLCFSRCLQ